MELRKFICDKSFLKRALIVSIPMIVQKLIESVVSLADTAMVSGVNENAIAAVSACVQWEFIAFLISFGVCSGIGIYVAQFYGTKDFSSLKKSFGLSIVLSLVGLVPFIFAAFLFPETIIRFYVNDPYVVELGKQYIYIAAISYIPSIISFAYSYVYRCIGQTKISMRFGIIAVLVNLALNYILIYGKLGFPAFGVKGAAIATLISRMLEMLLHIVYGRRSKMPQVGEFREMFGFKLSFVKPILKRCAPIFVNESLFGLGTTLFIKAFGVLGAEAVSSYAMANQVLNIFFIFSMGFATAATSMVGSELGKKEFETAKNYSRYFIGLASVTAALFGLVMVMISAPSINIIFSGAKEQVRNDAIVILIAFALRFGLRVFNSVIFAFLRAGGDSKFLFILDSGILWGVGLPLAFAGVYVFKMNIVEVVIFVQLEQVLRIAISGIRYSGGKWLKNVTDEV